MATFEDFLQLIREGEAVSPGVANRPTGQLDRNVRYLYDLIQSAVRGSSLILPLATVEAEARTGMAVYYDSTLQQFSRGLARLEATPSNGSFLTDASSLIWGVVSQKHNATLADLILFGFAELDLSQAIAGSLVAGTYYLSGTTPGLLVSQRPPVSVPVLRSDGRGQVFVSPQWVDFADRHVHHHFELTCRPAGTTTPPASGQRHVITAADSSLPGWLPAGHAVFAGTAPVGAVFGYNLALDPDLASAWPPLPTRGAYLELDRGLDSNDGFQGVPLGADGLAILDRNGIWWLSDCDGDVPWPRSFDSASPDSFSDSAGPECPRQLQMALSLWFTKFNAATDTTVVRSLRSRDSRLIVRCSNGVAGSAGDLEALLDLSFLTAPQDTELGYQVIKRYADGMFRRGAVVEGVYASSANVLVSGSTTRKLNPSDPASPLAYQGLVGISVDTDLSAELTVQHINLDGATEESFLDIMYLGLSASKESAYRAKFYVPADLALASPKVRLRLRILGRAAGTLPDLTVTARRLSRPSNGLAAPAAFPTTGSEFSVTIDTAGVLTSSNQYVEAVSEPITVVAGDVLYFRVSRAGSDGYAAEVGILEQVCSVEAGS